MNQKQLYPNVLHRKAWRVFRRAEMFYWLVSRYKQFTFRPKKSNRVVVAPIMAMYRDGEL
jgi:hypothetical protein